MDKVIISMQAVDEVCKHIESLQVSVFMAGNQTLVGEVPAKAVFEYP